uniref:UDP-N-acetylglucosamine--dolichyl-phosphate N-acetylglucosaminephosphotransferase n=2 Tax=Corethron hystrix TaxID=216773 RepID=A0A6U5M6S3_9STRA|mmetsp:Transcript_8726/g.19180  ORF Transcript_8726/g.19180 Transcript_8726/m.19180 type:complete len:306 (+) Transcript_8726:731-1648(+)
MLFLGFTDDVLDWPWRYKLLLPSVATLPLLCCYKGSTSIVVPIQLRKYLMTGGSLTSFGELVTKIVTVDTNADGAILNLGIFYLVYMGLLAVFCTNAINIYAGINGLEVGQSYIVACAILVHNLLELFSSDATAAAPHLFSAMIMFSFVGVTLGLLRHNWYPARVFVGDTYCYFAGMAFAVVGIHGHFSKTLLLFFMPQVANFLWSVPQLFKMVPCPRHRLPRFDEDIKMMRASTFSCKEDEFLWLKRGKRSTEVSNMTVINVVLDIFGPMTEQSLCIFLLVLQAGCCAFGLYLRYNLAEVFFGV